MVSPIRSEGESPFRDRRARPFAREGATDRIDRELPRHGTPASGAWRRRRRGPGTPARFDTGLPARRVRWAPRLRALCSALFRLTPNVVIPAHGTSEPRSPPRVPVVGRGPWD